MCLKDGGLIMREEIFMKIAVDIAYENVITNGGGPFGAIVVKNGQIISRP